MMDGNAIHTAWVQSQRSEATLVMMIDAALTQARAEAREACARLCENIGGVTGEELSARIRAGRMP